MMAALATIHGHGEIKITPRAQKDCRTAGTETRTVGRDQHVGGEQILMRLANFAQARRPSFLPRFDQNFRVEPQRPTRFQYR